MNRRRWRELLGAVAQTATLGTLAVVLFGFFGRSITTWATFGVAAVVVTAAHAQARLRERTDAPPGHIGEERFDRPFTRIGVLRQQVEWGLESPERFQRVLQPTLAAIAEERLLHRHGVEAGRRPGRGRELLGDELWQLLMEPAAAAPTEGELAHLLERIEKL